MSDEDRKAGEAAKSAAIDATNITFEKAKKIADDLLEKGWSVHMHIKVV